MAYPIFTLPVPAQSGSWTWPLKRTPKFATIKQTPASLRGQLALSLSPYPVWSYAISLGYVKGNIADATRALGQLIGFFTAVQGSSGLFLFSDPFDSSATSALFAVGDGSTTTFPLRRQLGAAGLQGWDLTQNPNFGSTLSVWQPGYGSNGLGRMNYLPNITPGAAPWGSNQCTVTLNAAADPNGGNTATSIVGNVVSGDGYLFYTATAAQRVPWTYTFSVLLKGSTNFTTYLALRKHDGTTGTSQACAVTTTWQRFSITVTQPMGYGVPYVLIGGGSTLQSGGPTLYAWGAQLEDNEDGIAPTALLGTTGTPRTYSVPQENLLAYSSPGGNGWGANQLAITLNAAADPQGGTTAASFAGTGTDGWMSENWGTHYISGTYTFSVWLRSSAATTVNIYLAPLSEGGTSTSCQLTADWQRFSVTATMTGHALPFAQIGGGGSVTSASPTIYAWGAQVEAGSSVSGYSPTTGSPVQGTGQVTFSVAPDANAALSWSGSFYHLCRFTDDTWADLQATQTFDGTNLLWDLKEISFESVLL